MTTSTYTLPLPAFFDPNGITQFDRYVSYHKVEEEALQMRRDHRVALAGADRRKIAFLAIDVQRTFCDPNGQLFVAGRSGTGAVDDSRRTAEFVYRNGRVISTIIPTLYTHRRAQIFHPAFWVDEVGHHPAPTTMISLDDLDAGRWRPNPAAAFSALGNAGGYRVPQCVRPTLREAALPGWQRHQQRS